MKKKITYKDAGVDIAKADDVISLSKNKIQEIPLNVLGLNKWVTAPFEKSKINKMRLSVGGCSPCGVANVQHFKYKTRNFINYK